VVEAPAASIGEEAPFAVGGPEVVVNLVARVRVREGVSSALALPVEGAVPLFGVADGEGLGEVLASPGAACRRLAVLAGGEERKIGATHALRGVDRRLDSVGVLVSEEVEHRVNEELLGPSLVGSGELSLHPLVEVLDRSPNRSGGPLRLLEEGVIPHELGQVIVGEKAPVVYGCR